MEEGRSGNRRRPSARIAHGPVAGASHRQWAGAAIAATAEAG